MSKHSVSEIEAVVERLTPKAREAMTAIGDHRTSYFDDGIVEYSGIPGEYLVSELGHKSAGVRILNRLRDMGLLEHNAENDVGPDWWSLTSLGADVANYLAGNLEVKHGTKWTYIYSADGSLIAEVRNDQIKTVAKQLAESNNS